MKGVMSILVFYVFVLVVYFSIFSKRTCWKQEVLEDPLTVSAIDEETEFNALVVGYLPTIKILSFSDTHTLIHSQSL